jgi:outer membrane protein TolC
MQLRSLGIRRTICLVLAITAGSAGCRRLPYIDPAREVPHDPGSLVSKEDSDVKQAQLLDSNLPVPLPRLADPRTTSNPEADVIWEMTLQEAIRIGLDNAEVVRVIPLGATGTPVGGFEPQFLAVGTGAGSALGQGNLSSVYDIALQETRIASALSRFDASLGAQLFWSRNNQPFNNSISTGFFSVGNRFPVVSVQDTGQFQATLQKQIATGGQLSVAHNINYQYSNSPVNAFPSVYTTNLQFSFQQPLLGSAPPPGTSYGGAPENNPNLVGVEANRAPIVIARLNADSTVWSFKSNVMAMVRSIEQQYWALAQASVQLWASETAVKLGEQIVNREQASYEVGTRKLADVAEAEEQLERFRLEYINRTADIVTTERQLRNLLGLPPADNRRIVPVTAPTEARIEPDWESSLTQMISYQPDIVQGQLVVRIAELRLLLARNQLLPQLNFNSLYQFNGLGHHLDQAEAVLTGKPILAIDPIVQLQQRSAGLNPIPGVFKDFQTWQVGFTFQMPIGYRGPLADVRLAQYALLQQRAYLQQVVHQSAHQLSRFFLEVDVNYKLYKAARRLKEAAKTRLLAQKAYYETGGITIDRYLDAVNRWANAVANEADFRTRYNTSIVLLEELKGTLLAYNNIVVAEGPWPAKAYIQARDQQAGHGEFPVGEDGNYLPRPVSRPLQTDPVPPATPPGLGPLEPVAPMPAPGGNLGPQPFPAPPALPAGEPPVLGGRELPALPNDGEVRRTIDPNTSGARPTNPVPMEMPLDLPPASSDLPTLPSGGAGDPSDLPTLPEP